MNTDSRNKILSFHISDPSVLAKCWMPFMRHGGIFLPAHLDATIGSRIFLLLRFSGDDTNWPVACRVSFVRQVSMDHRRPQGIGLQFLCREEGLLSRIKFFLEQSRENNYPAW